MVGHVVTDISLTGGDQKGYFAVSW